MRAHYIQPRITRSPRSSGGSRETAVSASSCVPTSIALDSDWIVVALANGRVLIFNAHTGVLNRTLVGHELGVWAVALVKGSGADDDDDVDGGGGVEELLRDDAAAGGSTHLLSTKFRHALGLDHTVSDDDTENQDPQSSFATSNKPSDPAGASDGWGQPNTLVVTGGCDRALRVWDVKSGYEGLFCRPLSYLYLFLFECSQCLYTLHGHALTIRCLKVLHGRPLAVSGSRDQTVRVWDIRRGQLLRTLEGHEQSVRCLDVCGDRIVSGSYDGTCRVWNIDTGECIHVLRGHCRQIYCVAFDGVRIVSGGIDTTVRIWDPETG